ncbi:MAG: PP2C family protein-serine/threonine phosphatase [Phycisphaerales bacterium]
MSAAHSSPATPRSVAITQEQLDAARLALLRQRVVTLGTVTGAILILLSALQTWIALETLPRPLSTSWMIRLGSGALAGVAFIVMPRLRRGRWATTSLRRLSWRTMMLVALAAFGQAPGSEFLATALTKLLQPLGFTGSIGPAIPLAGILLCIHTAAAIVVPWTTLEACIPPVALAVITTVFSAGAADDSPEFRVLGVSLLLLAGVPGVVISAFRSKAMRELFGLRIIGDRYAEVERELGTARRIHERLFPAQLEEGPLRMRYSYAPMRELGGDYLDAGVQPDGSLLLTLVDVTGHGVAAALAVNRLHGEIKRTVAQQSGAPPLRIVEALNEYILLTLADEQVFATAVVARVHPDGRVRLCVAGHPPALVRRADGRVEAIDSGAPALGMLPNDLLEAQESECTLAPGDHLLLYTDGAIEIWDARRVQWGVDGLRAAVACAGAGAGDPASLVDAVVRAVEAYRDGPSDDDTLVVSVTRAPDPA